MLKIGLFGAGHLGKIHLQLLLELESMYELVGFFDPDDQNACIAVEKFGLTRFETPEELMHLVDCIDIVTPTLNHFEIARAAIRLGKHIFIEKPITETLEEGEILVALASEGRTKIQVGHVERFNHRARHRRRAAAGGQQAAYVRRVAHGRIAGACQGGRAAHRRSVADSSAGAQHSRARHDARVAR